eukprot:365162-Chlamydomonas_euryale.AAC.8
MELHPEVPPRGDGRDGGRGLSRILSHARSLIRQRWVCVCAAGAATRVPSCTAGMPDGRASVLGHALPPQEGATCVPARDVFHQPSQYAHRLPAGRRVCAAGQIQPEVGQSRKPRGRPSLGEERSKQSKQRETGCTLAQNQLPASGTPPQASSTPP